MCAIESSFALRCDMKMPRREFASF
jgi:hypothetical protein